MTRVRPGWNPPHPWHYKVAEFGTLVLLIVGLPLILFLASFCDTCGAGR